MGLFRVVGTWFNCSLFTIVIWLYHCHWYCSTYYLLLLLLIKKNKTSRTNEPTWWSSVIGLDNAGIEFFGPSFRSPTHVVWQTKPVTNTVRRWISFIYYGFFSFFFFYYFYSGIVCPHSVRQRPRRPWLWLWRADRE